MSHKQLIEKIDNWEYYQRVDEEGCCPHANDSLTASTFILNYHSFKYCPFKNKIFKDYNIEFILLSGSHCAGLNDQYSDYDLDVYTTNDIPNKYLLPPGEFLKIDNSWIHWAYQSCSYLFNEAYSQDWINDTGLLYSQFLNIFSFIYIKNNNYDHPLVQSLLKYKKDIAYIGCIQLIKHLWAEIKQSQKVLTLYGKQLCNLIVAFYILQHPTCDRLPIDIIESLKEIKRQDLPFSQAVDHSGLYNYCLTTIQNLYSYTLNNSLLNIDTQSLKELVRNKICKK